MDGKRKWNHKSTAAFWPELSPGLSGRLGRQRAALGHPSSFIGMSQTNDSKSPALLILGVSLAPPAASSLVEPRRFCLNVSQFCTVPSTPVLAQVAIRAFKALSPYPGLFASTPFSPALQ